MGTDHYQRGVELFNRGLFFDAHEELEEAWRAESGEDRRFLQGLTQAAVGLHHHSTGNVTGACSLLARARGNLAGYPQRHRGLKVEALRRALEEFERALRQGHQLPPTPRMEPAAEER